MLMWGFISSILLGSSSRGLRGPSSGDILWEMFETPLILFMIGSSSAVLTYCTLLITNLGDGFSHPLLGTLDDLPSWLSFIAWNLAMATLSCAWTQFFCPDAVGNNTP